MKMSAKMGNAVPPVSKYHQPLLLRWALGLCWWMVHILFSIQHVVNQILQAVKSYFISILLVQSYRDLQLHKLRCLAIVVDSKEARNTLQIKKLLSWLSRIGVKYVTLYDMEGILKKSLAESQGDLPNGMLHKDRMMIELLSFIDSKEGIAKAASLLCTKYLKDELGNYKGMDPSITESDISDTLNVIGCGGPEPDLLLVYGPVRCHLGFPAWRIRYTEIVHMGSLKSMKYGDILTALYEFSKKKQNYGS